MRILVVDDEPHIRRLLEKWLTRAGHEVTCAGDGRWALESVAAAPPDFIFLDVMMPWMDGFEVLSTLRKDPAFATIPVTMLTAKSADPDFCGWVDGPPYLMKPFGPDDVLMALDRVVADAAPEPTAETENHV